MPHEDMSRDRTVAEMRAEQAEAVEQRRKLAPYWEQRRKQMPYYEDAKAAAKRERREVWGGIFFAAFLLYIVGGMAYALFFSQPMSLEEAESLDDYCPGPPYSNC